MARPASRACLLVASLVLGAAEASAAPPSTLPRLPAANPPPAEAKQNAPSESHASTPKPSAGSTDFEQLRRGVVQVEQGGRPLAVGMVLSKDGRILTSLSALGPTTEPEVRYADNTVVKTKLGHKDKTSDLALLIPQSGRWLDGLVPTDADPIGVELKAFLPKAGKLAGATVGVKGRLDARGKDGDPLKSVFDLDLKGLPGIPGAPVLDPNGRVVAVILKACKDAASGASSAPANKPAPCSPVTIGMPVPVLRGFLMKTPADAVQPAPWLGLGGAPSDSGNVKGVRVMGIAPGSPAAQAGLKAGGDTPDTIVAVDGQPIESPEQLADAIGKRAIGQTVKLLVFSQGRFREAPVTLRAAP